MKERLKELAKGAGVLFLLVVAFLIFVKITGRGISCPIYKFTGLLCGGCGITRMCSALIHLDFAAAFYYNCVYTTLLPLWFITGISYLYNYVRYGKSNQKKWHQVVLTSSIVILLVFAVLRNIIPLGVDRSQQDYYSLFQFWGYL